jgi:hypothetical protein
MSFSNVSQRILEPVLDRAGLRCEFQLPSDTAFLSDLRLINIGLTSTSATDSPNPLLGILGAIKRISILDGGTQLDSIELATIYNAFRNANGVNDSNLSVNRFLKYLQTGYVFQGKYNINAGGQFDISPPKITQQNPNTYTGNAIDGKRAWISLKDLMPFLRSALVLPTSVFRQLRVVVEYNSSAELQFLTRDSTATKTTSADALLLADEVMDGEMKDALMKEFRGVAFRPIEHEQVVAPAITGLANVAGQATQEQKNSYLLTGANGKRLSKMVVVQTPTESSTWLNAGGVAGDVKGFGNVGSVAQFQTGVQLIVNGVPKMPNNGMRPSATGSYANRRLAYLNDSWGLFNIINNQNAVSLNQPRSADYLEDQNLIGQQDYIGVLCDENISELQLQYDRKGVHGNDGLNQQLLLNCFYEVEKAVVMNNDMTYNVVYTQ